MGGLGGNQKNAFTCANCPTSIFLAGERSLESGFWAKCGWRILIGGENVHSGTSTPSECVSKGSEH